MTSSRLRLAPATLHLATAPDYDRRPSPGIAHIGVGEFARAHRFSNPSLGHTCVQVAEDGSRKVPQRLLPVTATRRQRGLAFRPFASVVAIWISAVAGLPLAGVTLPAVTDPAQDLLRAAFRHSRHHLVKTALGDEIPEGFVEEVVRELSELERNGMYVLAGDQ